MYYMYSSEETHDVMENKKDTSRFLVCSFMREKHKHYCENSFSGRFHGLLGGQKTSLMIPITKTHQSLEPSMFFLGN